jgi:pyrroloquinoline quinone (PQQ) biosynthesis protein C
MDNYFENSLKEVVNFFSEKQDLDVDEVNEVLQMLEELKKSKKGKKKKHKKK